jgi:hypothetical protein
MQLEGESQIIKELRLFTCFSIALVWFLEGILLIYQTFLLLCGMTGYELNRGGSKVKYLQGREVMDLPFNRGLIGNIFGVFRRDNLLHSIKQHTDQGQIFETWKLHARKNIRDVEFCENLWANKYYNCC